MQRYYGTLISNKKILNGIWFTDGINLTFNKRSASFVVLFGMLSDAVSIGKQVITIPISSIKNIERFKFRLNKNAIRLTTESGIIELTVGKHKRFFDLVQSKI